MISSDLITFESTSGSLSRTVRSRMRLEGTLRNEHIRSLLSNLHHVVARIEQQSSDNWGIKRLFFSLLFRSKVDKGATKMTIPYKELFLKGLGVNVICPVCPKGG